jgi:hypothetical protein
MSPSLRPGGATELANLVDLRTALANDGIDHVVGNEDLLWKRLARHCTNRCVRGSAVRKRSARSAQFSRKRHIVEWSWSVQFFRNSACQQANPPCAVPRCVVRVSSILPKLVSCFVGYIAQIWGSGYGLMLGVDGRLAGSERDD